MSDPVTIFVCGDMNAPPDSKVYKTVCKHGYQSAYRAVNKKEPSVTHKDHRGNQVAADYVFYRSVLGLQNLSLEHYCYSCN